MAKRRNDATTTIAAATSTAGTINNTAAYGELPEQLLDVMS